MHPRIGQWAVSGVTWYEGAWEPDGCFPIAWRDTLVQATEAARKMLDAGQTIYVAEVIPVAQGFTLGEYHVMGDAP